MSHEDIEHEDRLNRAMLSLKLLPEIAIVLERAEVALHAAGTAPASLLAEITLLRTRLRFILQESRARL